MRAAAASTMGIAMPSMLPGTGNMPASPHAVVTGATSTADAGGATVIDSPISLELLNASGQELAGARAGMSSSGLDVQVIASEVSVQEVIRTLDQPVGDQSDRLIELRERLQDQVRMGTGDVAKAVRQLDGLSLLIEMVKRQDEKKRLMKKIIAQLMAGALTPATIAMAKSLGLVNFLREAIKALVKQGGMSPSAIKALAVMLGQAGIQMPLLDDLLIRNERSVQSTVNAARVASGQPATTIGIGGDAATGAQTLNSSLGAARSS